MSIHLQASPGQIAETVLLPGDPVRATFIAETYLENPVCHNQIRGMYGYTGTYKGQPVSVQGTGMGIPSIAIYVHELIVDYRVKNLIRIGSCGAIQKDIGIRDVILAMSASTDSNFNKQRFNQMDFAPTASFGLLQRAWDVANRLNIKVDVGNVLTSDIFYYEDGQADPFQVWKDYGVLVVEMETTALYTLAARYGVNALSILTVSDNIYHNLHITTRERERSFRQMIEIALEVAGGV
ncbi:MAG: purine-nucleoside phosphorylase [Bacteroidales bacterium]|nr:purine-nucleoside phosphorylase [Lentimicrobiaceae bacterium]MDD5694975.1 purine-nucleoside phosphorylase [Bacteroidales bacterium]